MTCLNDTNEGKRQRYGKKTNYCRADWKIYCVNINAIQRSFVSKTHHGKQRKLKHGLTPANADSRSDYKLLQRSFVVIHWTPA